MINKPLVSVMMPTYNNAKYIKQAIDSIYAQNYDNMEIVVVDDGSTDNTKKTIEEYKDIKYFYINHKGIPFARNVALTNTKGEYIAFCDSDDYWLPGKLNTQLQYFKDHSDCEIVFTKYENFFENENLNMNERAVFEKNVEGSFKQYLPSSLIKRELFEKYGFFDENFQTGEDAEFITRLKEAKVDIGCFIDTVFYKRRLHGNNTTLVKSPKYKVFLMDFLRKKVLKRRDK